MKTRSSRFLLLFTFALFTACGGGGGGGGATPLLPPPPPPAPPVLVDPGTLGDGRMQEVVSNVLARHEVPALGAIIVRNGMIADRAVDGLRAIESGAAVTLDDSWHIGSITKAMTATLAAVLVEQSLLSWDTTPADVWPAWANTMHPQYRDVTVVQLLAHQSGLPVDITLIPSLALIEDSAPGTLVEKRLIWAEELLNLAPVNGVGDFLYTNAGYLVAGAMLETVTGTPWETLMNDNVFGPLGMSSTGYGAPGTSNLIDQPLGHIEQNGSLVSVPVGPGADNPQSVGPAGTVNTTLSDYALYMFAHIEGELGMPSLVSAASFQFLHAPVGAHSYAMGWDNDNSQAWSNGPLLVHNGSNLRWLATVGLAPGLNAGVLIVSNAANSDTENAIDELGQQLVQRLLASP
jgi:CubicO group peptidase (beta-lactamase class C family)